MPTILSFGCSFRRALRACPCIFEGLIHPIFAKPFFILVLILIYQTYQIFVYILT
eukprot:UN11913